jgi:hypothetical protein
MNAPVLHLLDATSTPDGLEMLGTLLEADGTALHRVVVMGHATTVDRAIAAGVPEECIERVHSMGALDPAGWRGVRRMMKRITPTSVHAWGFSGLAAATVVGGSAGRVATFTTEPAPHQRIWLKKIAARAKWRWLATSDWVQRDLENSLQPTRAANSPRVEILRPGIRSSQAAATDCRTLRISMGIAPEDGPIILLGGEITEPAARQAHGLWAAAIVQKIYPAARVMVHPGLPRPFCWRDEVISVRQLAATAPDPRLIIYSSPQLHWRDVLQVATVMVVTPDQPININSVLWAMAVGVPVVARATPQMAELIDDGRTGVLVGNKPRDAAAGMDRVLDNAEFSSRLADAAKEHVRSAFAAGPMVERLRGIYENKELAAGEKM